MRSAPRTKFRRRPFLPSPYLITENCRRIFVTYKRCLLHGGYFAFSRCRRYQIRNSPLADLLDRPNILVMPIVYTYLLHSVIISMPVQRETCQSISTSREKKWGGAGEGVEEIYTVAKMNLVNAPRICLGNFKSRHVKSLEKSSPCGGGAILITRSTYAVIIYFPCRRGSPRGS